MRIVVVSIALLVCISCHKASTEKGETKPVRLVTLDPGHFHAALVQKSMYENVDSVVHVYAPESPDVQLHLERIKAFNSRKENPTRWTEKVYDGEDFFEEMLAEKAGNVVVLAGNNRKKTDYIHKSLSAGFNVLADKPMAITSEGFQTLEKAFDVAKRNNLVLYDIMTERFEITSILQREFSMSPEIFGTLEKGTPDNPAVIMNGVHYFYKYVSGNVLKRPPWFMDVTQEGNGIVDVTTHLVDLVQWECFPNQVLDYKNDVEIFNARRWTTDMTLHEFNSITGLTNFPDYLKSIVKNDSVLGVYCNGEINYRLKGVHAKVSVEWNYKATVGADTHYSIMRGTKANLIISQGVEENFQPTLYIESTHADPPDEFTLEGQLKKIQDKYPGVELKQMNKRWVVIIPNKFKEGHEAHFARVTENFLEYLQKGNMPAWEVPNMLAKYYTTTRALELAIGK
jgi:predicted dehydrogenase